MLQKGLWPRRREKAASPDAPLSASHYQMGKSAATMPSESFQYEVVYDAFRADTEFWRHWKVVDCARNSSEQTQSRGNATIRVVLDLPASQRLFPTAYTPGFPTLPFGATNALGMESERCTITWEYKDTLPVVPGDDMHTDDYIEDIEEMKQWCQENPDCVGFAYDPISSRWKPKRAGTGFDPRTATWERPTGVDWRFYYIRERAEARKGRDVRAIPGLPPGYSVALEVHLLEEARIMLAHQRSFRAGKIDPSVEWLDHIVRKVDGETPDAKPEPRAKRSSRPKKMLAGGGGADSTDRPEADLRPPVGSLPLDSSEPGLSEDVKAFSDLYGDTVTKHVGLGRNQVYAENTLISAFGADVRLPKPESGSWAGPVQKSLAERLKEEREGRALDSDLESLLQRTAEGRGSKGGLLAGRLDR